MQWGKNIPALKRRIEKEIARKVMALEVSVSEKNFP